MDRVISKEFEIFCGKDIKPDDWLWCNRCPRCYKAFEYRKMKGKGEIFVFCPCIVAVMGSHNFKTALQFKLQQEVRYVLET